MFLSPRVEVVLLREHTEMVSKRLREELGRFFVEADHRIDLIWRAYQRGRIGERYLLGHRNVTFGTLVQLIASQAGVPPPRLRVSYPLAFAVATVSEFAARLVGKPPLIPRMAVAMVRESGQGFDCSKAIQELGMPQTSLEEAIHRSLAWFRQHGYL